jgi:hypothetical protein
MLVRNKKFKAIFSEISEKWVDINAQISAASKSENERFMCDYPYIGMGNPDAKILFVGSEKGFNPMTSLKIDLHERKLNFIHWNDILNNYNHLRDHFHPILKLRKGLDGFNPFSPLTLNETAEKVYGKGNHTYKKMEKIIQAQFINYTSSAEAINLLEITPGSYHKSLFKYCFVTEISDLPKSNQNQGSAFNFNEFKKSCRYSHLLTGKIGDFYRSFKTVIIYAGSRYAGAHNSKQRAEIISLFNPNINMKKDYRRGYVSDIYETKKGGAKIIVCPHITSYAIFRNDHIFTHDFAVMDIGKCI